MTARHFQASNECFWVPIRYTELLFGENWAQLFWDSKVREGIKYKAKFEKCTLQSYKFKIYSRRTETSVIYDEPAKAVAYLCGQSRVESWKNVTVDFLKSTLKSIHEIWLHGRQELLNIL